MRTKINLSILCLLLMISRSFAQSDEKVIKKHLSKIEKSKSGQKVEISLDTLFHNGMAWCIYDEGEKLLGNVLDITIKDLAGNEVIWAKMVTGEEINRADVVTAYELTFVQSNNKALFVNVLGNSLSRELVKYNVFENGNFNPLAEYKFINFNPFKTGLINNGNGSGNIPQNQNVLIERNRNQMIQIFGKEIKQDFKLIGYLSESRQSAGGKMVISFTITLPNGTLVANARNEDAFSHTWQIITSKDNKAHTVTSSLGNDNKDVVTYLVKMLYL